ncbi:NUDIX domain-containing protein [Candidatus Beckwithbacteria bacterium]|nr:NUDIX domain-containing protein [Candidatus Beckwithbacteria bacterium]
MKARVIVTAVIEKKGQILFGWQKQGRGPYPNTWHLPGGGVNLEDESLEKALKREIMEETNLEIDDIKPIGFDEDYTQSNGQDVHYVFLSFSCQVKAGEAKASDDLAEVKWVKKEDIKNLKLPKPSVRLFKKLHIL